MTKDHGLYFTAPNVNVKRFSIPTRNTLLSVTLSAVTTVALLSAAAVLLTDSFAKALLLSPFLSGFLGALAYGATYEKGPIQPVLTGILAFLAFTGMTVMAVTIFRIAVYQPLLVTVFFPLPLMVVVGGPIAVIGAIFGWIAALAARR